MSDLALNMMFTEAKSVLGQNPDASLIDRLKSAFKVTGEHWMFVGSEYQDTAFRAAVAAVMDSYPEDSEERRRLKHEIDALQRLAALIHAAQAGLDVGLREFPGDEEGPKPEPIGLMNLWRETVRP